MRDHPARFRPGFFLFTGTVAVDVFNYALPPEVCITKGAQAEPDAPFEGLFDCSTGKPKPLIQSYCPSYAEFHLVGYHIGRPVKGEVACSTLNDLAVGIHDVYAGST